MSEQLKIIIVGGGTAGWMAANLMCKHWSDRAAKITVVESPDIGIVGVGEGSTPQLKRFFDTIGIQEQEWMSACDATYKTGITFKGWSEKPGFGSYFHPFPSQLDQHTAKAFFRNCYLRRQGYDVDAHPDSFFLQAFLANQQRIPLHPQVTTHYGYHFDAYKVGAFLSDVARKRGVEHVRANVTRVDLTNSGHIDGLNTDTAGVIGGDVFVDCTGFKSHLLQGSLGVKFVSFKDNLFNDAAVVLPTAREAKVNTQTISTAMRNGWAWDIPLTSRTGNGYVYSTEFCTDDEAETELRQKLGLLDADVEARKLSMKVGRVATPWHKNCLAVGLSQGFIEPLEATALQLVHDTVDSFIRYFERGNRSEQYQSDFNAKINATIEGIRDYIVCHYKVNSRTDSDYWKACAENLNLSDSLSAILSVWFEREDLTAEIIRQDIGHYYHPISWHCLLAGYGLFPGQHDLKQPDEAVARHDLSSVIRQKLMQHASMFPISSVA